MLLVLAPVFVVALVVVALVVRPGQSALKSGEAEVEVDGTAVVTTADGRSRPVTDRIRMHAGDTLKMQSGTASITTRDAVFQAMAGSGKPGPTRLLMGTTPELLGGELLATSEHRTQIDSAGSSVTVGKADQGGAVRLTRTLALRVSVYQGSATLESAGSSLQIPALRAAEVAALGQLPANPSPLRFRSTDRWDRAYLSPAITVDQQLDPLTLAFNQSSTGQITAASLHLSDLPSTHVVNTLLDRAREVDDTLSRPADAIVGAAVTSLAQKGTFEHRWNAVFRFHSQGATWGLVAMDQHVSADSLLDRVRGAIDQSPLRIGGPTVAAAQPTAPVIGGPGAGAPSGTTIPADGSGATGSGSGTPGTTVTSPSLPALQVPQPTTPLLPSPLPQLPPVTVPPQVTSPLQGLVDTTTQLLSGLLNGVAGKGGLLGG